MYLSDPKTSAGRLLPSEEDWSLLSQIPWKRREYPSDGHFRQGWAEAAAKNGDFLLEFSQQFSVVVIKPEAVVGRRALLILDRLTKMDFKPVFARLVTFDSAAVHAAWRFQLDAASDDRIRVQTGFRPLDTPGVYIGLIRPEKNRSIAQLDLAANKGSPHPERQCPGTLRAQLGAPNAMNNFLHVPDDPADVLREAPVWLDECEREHLRGAFQARETSDGSEAGAFVRMACEKCEVHDLDPRAALARLRQRALQAREKQAIEILDQCDAAMSRHLRGLNLAKFERALGAIDVPRRSWDSYLVATQLIDLDVPLLRASGC